jgi:hypothetical protein
VCGGGQDEGGEQGGVQGGGQARDVGVGERVAWEALPYIASDKSQCVRWGLGSFALDEWSRAFHVITIPPSTSTLGSSRARAGHLIAQEHGGGRGAEEQVRGALRRRGRDGP